MVSLAGSMLQLNEHAGDLSRAESIVREALEILRHNQGEDHPNTFSALWVLADAYGKEGKFPDEDKTYAELLEAGRRFYGEEDPFTIEWMAGSAQAALNVGKLSRAEPLAVKALELSRRISGQEHVGTLGCLEVVGRVYQAQGQLPEAERAFGELVESSGRVRGAEHPHTWRAIVELTRVYLRQDKTADAERLIHQAGAAITKGVSDPPVNAVYWFVQLGNAFEEAGRIEAAAAAYQVLVAGFQSQIAKAPDQPGPPNSLAWLLATCPLKEIRDPKRAVELARKSIDLAPDASHIWNTLGVALYRAGDWKAAIEALEESERLAPDKYLPSNGIFPVPETRAAGGVPTAKQAPHRPSTPRRSVCAQEALSLPL